MNLANYIKNNHLELSLAGFFFILILLSKLAAVYIVFMALIVFWNYKKKQIRFQLDQFSLLFVAFYLCYAIGVYWTEDAPQASRYLENKLGFLIFPLLFAFKKNSEFNLRIIYFGLIGATLAAFAYGISIAIPCYLDQDSFPYCFLKSHLSPFMHPTYMSVFVMLSIVVSFAMYKRNEISLMIAFIIIGILVVYTFLLLSLAGLLGFVLLIFFYFLYRIKERFSLVVMSIVAAVCIGVLVFIGWSAPFVKLDIQSTVKTCLLYYESPSDFVKNLPEEPSSAQTRLVMWSVSVEEIKKHPFGVGTGNVDIYLGNNLRKKGNAEFADKAYNPHNQFLQTQLEIGLIGVIILLMITIGGIKRSIRLRNGIMLVLFSSLLFNCLFESMLQLQAGILFYLFFFLLLMIGENSDIHKVSKTNQ
jgi:O-antigen ligase